MDKNSEVMFNEKLNKTWQFWRLDSKDGRQIWHLNVEHKNQFSEHEWKGFFQKEYTFNKKVNPNSADLIYRNSNLQQLEPYQYNPLLSEEENALLKGFHFYQYLQAEDGNFPGDYGGPHFLLPGLIFASYITSTPFSEEEQILMKQYMLNHQNEDGGWGLHIEDESTMFGSVLQYVALRILGEDANLEHMQKARTWILENGGATHIPAWGKFYLSMMNMYDWKGQDSLFPEMWILPKWLPIHPSRFWCHARMVYLPMAYCMSQRITMPENDLIHAVRSEIYTTDYDNVNWKKARNQCCAKDLKYPKTRIYKAIYSLLNIYEQKPLKFLRKKADDFMLSYIQAEDKQTNYIDIGPVNKVINSIAIWHAKGKDSEEFKKHVERWKDYLWVAEDGMKMQGYNSSTFWDTAFAMQALIESNAYKKFPTMLKKAYHFFDVAQVRRDEENREKWFRLQSKGGWPFSNADHGWPITDCTSEGIKTTIMANQTDAIDPFIDFERLKDGIDLLLDYQNKDGGWASYEKARAPKWIEVFNPAEIFGNIMIDYSYVECSSACVQGLTKFTRTYPNYRTSEIEKAIQRGIEFIRSKQLPDGSYFGSWAVCFTYGAWFAIEALSTYKKENKLNYNNDETIRKACDFLVQHQNADGGWGESYKSCVEHRYINANSHVVNTAWALMGLMAADYPEKSIIDKGIQYLLTTQMTNGDFPQQSISGLFNHNCMITYTAYRNVFPLWAIGRYINQYQKNAK